MKKANNAHVLQMLKDLVAEVLAIEYELVGHMISEIKCDKIIKNIITEYAIKMSI